MLNKAIAKWKLNCIHEVFMFTSFYLQSSEKAKDLQIVLHQRLVSWPTMSLQHAMNWFTLKWSRLVEDKRFCIFIWHIFWSLWKQVFWTWTILWHLWSYYRFLYPLDRYMVHGCTSLNFHYREMSNMWPASVRAVGLTCKKEYFRVPSCSKTAAWLPQR